METENWTTLWRVDVPNGYDVTPSFIGDRIYINAFEDILCFDAATGKKLAKVEREDSWGRLMAIGDSVFAYFYGYLAAQAFDRDLKPMGSYSPTARVATVFEYEGRLVVVTDDMAIVSLRVEDGTFLKEELLPGGLSENQPLAARRLGNTVFFCSTRGVALFDLERREFLKDVPLDDLKHIDLDPDSCVPMSPAEFRSTSMIKGMMFEFSPLKIRCGDLVLISDGKGASSTDFVRFDIISCTTRSGELLWEGKNLPMGTMDYQKGICVAGLPEEQGALMIWELRTGNVLRVISHSDVKKLPRAKGKNRAR